MSARAMRSLWVLSRKELTLLRRDWHGMLVLFVVPVAFILIMSLALRDAFGTSHTPRMSVAVEDRDQGALAEQTIDALSNSGMFTLVAADVSDASIHLTLLGGYSELLGTRHELAEEFRSGMSEPDLVEVRFEPDVPPQLRAAASLGIRQAVLQVQSDFLMTEVMALPAQERLDMRFLTNPMQLPVRVVSGDASGAVGPTAVQQNVPAWLIFAMFFSVIPLATAFVIERQQGSLLRLRVLGVPPGILLASKALPYYLVNLLQLVLMLAIGVWIVPLLGGDRLTLGQSLVGLWLIGTATSAAAIGLALLVAVQVRTTLQATIAGGAISLILAALGGVMVPKMVMPPDMQTVTLVSPMAWSLEGFWDIVLRQGNWRDALPESAALLGFGAICLIIAALRFRRSLHSETTTNL